MEGINDLKLIKKHYNEKFAHLCRELFPTILETPGLLYELLIKNFEPSKFLYEDIIRSNKIDEFKRFIYTQIAHNKEPLVDTSKTPEELLKEVGYTLYECKTESEIQRFKEYYAPGEALCTFRGGRLDRCYVFFAVKDNSNKIRRRDFINPERQDEYGTSVISIQFTKDSANTVSIKNRYNHAVINPDATFSNNLDNIIPGLTQAFNKKYHLNAKAGSDDFEIYGYVRAKNRKYYKYNCEENNIYYCPNNVIIDNFEVKYYDPAKYIVLESFILDLQNKTIEPYDKNSSDSFAKTIGKIEKIEQSVNKATGERTITINDDIVIVLDKRNRILRYTNTHVEEIGSNFLGNNRALEVIEIPNVKIMKRGFLGYNTGLKELDLPNLEEFDSTHFMPYNKVLKRLNLPKITEIRNYFLKSNTELEEINIPNVEKIGVYFLYGNDKLAKIDIPKVKEIRAGFLYFNDEIETLSFPNVETIDSDFLYHNSSVRSINFPKLEIVGEGFLCYNQELERIRLLNLKEVGPDFIFHNSEIKEAILPKLEKVGPNFLYKNDALTKLDLPALQNTGLDFLSCNTTLQYLSIPRVKEIGRHFLTSCDIKQIYMPRVKTIRNFYEFTSKPFEIINGMRVRDGNTERILNEILERNNRDEKSKSR